MLREAAGRLVDAGATLIRTYEDRTGMWGYRLRAEGEQFIMVAKQFDHKEQASFLKESVERALSTDAWLLFYNDESKSYTVFDPEWVAQEGDPSEGHSKTRHAEWLEIPMAGGADIIDFTHRRRRPRSPRRTDAVGLDQYGVDL